MRSTIAISLVTVLSAGASVRAQPALYAISAAGDVIRINPATGAGVLVGPTGLGGANAAAADSQGRLFTHSSDSGQLILVNPATGAGTVFLSLTGRPIGYGIRGMAFDASDHLYVALSQADTTIIDTLATIDTTSGAYSVLGPTGRTDVQDLAFDVSSGVLYGAGVFGGLYRLDPTTGAATVIGGSFSGDDQALAVDDHGVLYSCRANLRIVDSATGLTMLVGPTGFTDIRGMAFVRSAPVCYANCDNSTIAPILNVNDFICFQTRFAAGDSYANCDNSTAVPLLNVNDFICFQTRFAAGCL